MDREFRWNGAPCLALVAAIDKEKNNGGRRRDISLVTGRWPRSFAPKCSKSFTDEDLGLPERHPKKWVKSVVGTGEKP